MRRALTAWASVALLITAIGGVGASSANAQAEFGLNPDTFTAKTHPHVPLKINGDPSETRNREVDIASIRTADPVTDAGAHPDASTHFALRTDESEPGELRPEGIPPEDVKDVIIDLPAGFVGDPEAVPACTRARFEVTSLDEGRAGARACPPASQVGVAHVAPGEGLNPAGVDIAVPVYRVTRPAGAPAAFALKAGAQNIVLTPEVRSEGDYGLRIESLDTAGFPVKPVAVTVTLWGVPADPRHDPDRWSQAEAQWGTHAGIQPRPFIINPPRCNTGALPVHISMRSWQQPGRWLPRDLADPAEAAQYTALSPEPTGCAFLPAFEPEFDMRPVAGAAGAPSGYEATLSMPYNDDPSGRAGAHVKRVEVELPEGVTVNPSSAHGLEACTDAEAGFGTRSVANCPSASRLAEVAVDTPLLSDPLKGNLYLGSPTDDQLLRVFIIVEGFGVVVRVEGDVHTDPDTGQVTAVFDDNPQVPFTNLRVRFDSGSRAALVNPQECGRHETVTRITSWNDDEHVSRSGFTISSDGSGGACPATLPFAPWLDADTINGLSGEFTDYFTRFGRSDRDAYVDSIDLDLPEGLVARIADVPLCPARSADMGACNEHSRIGHVKIAAGAGDRPYIVPGPGKDPTAVYLSGPYRGAPYSLSIVVPSQAGPLDLGRVVVRAPIDVDARTTELSIDIAESRIFDRFGDLDRVIPGRMPTILEGIPLRIKEVRVIVDREEFIVNPTNCSVKQFAAGIGSVDGRTSQVTSPFRAIDCAALDFAPRFGMRILNRDRRSTLRSFNPAMRFGVAPRQGHANIAAAAVTLPSSIILDQSNIRTICTRDQFAARECPQAAIYGFARAWSPLLKRPIQGPVYLGSSDNQLPDLIADMRGEVRVILQGEILGTSDGRIRNVFRFVPDVQVSRFQLTMLGGSNRGILVNSQDLCRSPERGVTHFFGQNGKRQVTRPRVGLSFRGCRQVLRREAIRQAKRRRALRKAVRAGKLTPAQARRQIRS